MSVQIESLSPVIDATPGQTATGRIRITNDSASSTRFSIGVVGLSAATSVVGPPAGPAYDIITVDVDAGATLDADIPVPIPVDIAVGQHSAAFQATSSRSGERPVLAPFTVSVESVEKVNLTVEPTPIRGRRRSKFIVGVVNDEPTPVAFTLSAEATDVRVRFKNSAFRLVPGQHASTKATVKGPRHMVGEEIQHNLVIAARGKASATTITAPFVQRPIFAHKLRALTAGLAVIALWLAAIGGVALWIQNRNDDAEAQNALEAENAALIRLVDADGVILANGPYVALADGTVVDSDGIVVDGFSIDENGNLIDDKGNPVNGVVIDAATGELVDADGTPIGLPAANDPDGDGTGNSDGSGDGQTADGSGNGQTAGESGGDGTGDGADDEPVQGVIAEVSTDFRGTIGAVGSDDLSDVAITLVSIDLGAEARPGSTALDTPGQTPGQNGVPDGTSASKVWSARFAPLTSSLGPLRQTEPAQQLGGTVGDDGVWLIKDVALRQTYELSFAKAGFDTQAFVISPPDDGTPVELDVTLEPSTGLISGQVLDGGVPLGGAEIAISDGTLAFTTTSSTDGDVGSFAFEAVSTPGVYTLTAKREGYGTVVLQLPTTAGQQRDDVVINMQDGVATASGSIVNEFGTPLGGVTVTATNGEITRTTSSLTDGNRGFYSIPQLDIPATYTITVSIDGYVPQTRRVPLGGSLGGINFSLINTTSSLGGVVSSGGGGGVVGALVTLSNADLRFETSSAATPQPGSFAVDDLPPGTYTVAFEHFEHDTVTELIDITEGIDPPSLNVTLPVRTRGIDAGTGSLVVEVIDPGAEDAEDREIRGATVTLVTTRTGDVFTSRTDPDSFTFEFSDVPVATYTILVSAPLYNDAAPRTVSIGQSQERRTVELVSFGAASGSMIDSITGEVIKGYTVKFFEQDAAGGAEREIGPAEVNVPSSSETGSWATAPRVLPTGTYRLEVSGSAGYREPATQILDPLLPQMQFRIELNSGEATEIPTLIADRFPDIFGRVYEPTVIGGPAAPATGTQFRAIDSPSLAAQMSCNGGPGVAMTVSSEFGGTGADQLDAFFLSRQAVDANDLIGNCEISVSADGYVTGIIPMPNVAVSDGITLSDRVVTTALAPPVDDLNGEVFWIDPRTAPTKLPLGDVEIFAVPITSITPTDGGPLPPGPEPSVARSRIETESSNAVADRGTWTLPGQIFGGARYTFRLDGFQDGTVDVIVDENANRAITDVGGVIVTETGGFISVQLQPPDPVQILGGFDIISNDQTKRFSDITITARNPANGPVAVCVSPATNGCILRDGAGSFRVNEATAGTWTVDFDFPANAGDTIGAGAGATAATRFYRLFDGETAQEQHRIGPQEPDETFDTRLVELGTLDLELINSVNNVAITSFTTVRLTPVNGTPGSVIEQCFGAAPPSIPPAPPNPPCNGASNGVYQVTEIPVSLATDPEVNPTPFQYSMEIVAAGFDQSSGAVSLSNFGLPIAPTGPIDGARSIPLSFLAGDKQKVDLRLEPFGSIDFDVRGQIEPCTQPGGNYASCPTTNYENPFVLDLTRDISVQKVLIDGSPDTDVDTGLIGVSDLTNGRYQVVGPPGYYRIEVSHPEFKPTLLETPLKTSGGGATCIRFCDPSGVPLVYQLENGLPANDLNGDFTLELRDSLFNLEALETLQAPGGTPVDGATVELQLDNGAGFVTVYTETTNASGIISPPLPVLPRNEAYRLRVSKPGHFTAITTIVVQRSTGVTPYTVNVRAPLPQVGGQITGTLIALNDDNPGQPVAMPEVSITTAFDIPDIEVSNDSAAVNDVAGTGDGQGTAPADLVLGSTTYTVTGLPAGLHDVRFEVPEGYFATFGDNQNVDGPTFTTLADQLVPSMNGVLTLPDLTYKVRKVSTVQITVSGVNAEEIFPDLRVQLLPPGVLETSVEAMRGDFDAELTSGDPAADRPTPITAVFSDVAPNLLPYSLVVTDALHDTLREPLTVDVDLANDGQTVTTPFRPVARDGRIRGLVGLRDSTGLLPIDSQTVFTVLLNGAPLAPQPPVVVAPDSRSYHIDVPPAAGTHQVEVSRPTFSTERATVPVNPGRAEVSNFELSQTATIVITLSPEVPAGTTVYAEQTAGDTSNEAVRDTPTSNVFTAVVPSGTTFSYRARAVGPDLNVVSVEPATSVTAGSTVDFSINIPRRIQITVDDDTPGSTSSATNRTVEIYSGNTMVASRMQQQNTASPRVFVFDETDLPASGPLTVRALRNNRRTATLDLGAVHRTYETVRIYDRVDVSGIVNATVGGTTGPVGNNIAVDLAVASGTPQDAVPTSADTNGDGEYALNNLTNEADGSAVTYTLTVSEPGLGADSATITIGSDTPASDALLQNFELVPRPITVTFTVNNDDDNGLVDNASVVFGGQTILTGSGTNPSGQAEFAVFENTPLGYTISASPYVPITNGMIDPITTYPTNPAPFTEQVDLVPETTTITFNATNVLADAADPEISIDGSAVSPTLANVSNATMTGRTYELQIPRTRTGSLTWTINSGAYQEASGTVSDFSSDVMVNAPLTLEQFGGTVTVNNAAVPLIPLRICVFSTADTDCSAGTPLGNATGGTFSFPHPGAGPTGDEDRYRVVATFDPGGGDPLITASDTFRVRDDLRLRDQPLVINVDNP